MPIVTIKCIERVLSEDEQHRLIDAIHEAFVQVVGEAVRPHLIVLMEEVRSGLWSRGGERLTSEGVRAGRSGARKRDTEGDR
ncbi:MAG TPA: tautomerase family protein [Steroidobacter sp.]|uniref:tautomerase family protein n=1 Tax=Steroidobacter sp. TaxID=1978227 RepID=UPI002ED9650B